LLSLSAGTLTLVSTHPERLGKASGHARRLAVLVGLLAALALIVSGAGPATAQNAVGSQPVQTILTVGPHDAAAQTSVGVRGPPQLRLVSATGVAAEADQAALDHATAASKLDHVFAAKHNFDPLVEQFGSREAVVREFLNGLRGLTPASGTLEQQLVVGGQTVIVRGAVLNGVVKIGTAFTP
jgi:hypothetical protein